MAAITDVTLTAGVPTAGTGTVTTLDKFDSAAGVSATRALTVQGIGSGTALPVSVATIPSHAVTNAGTFLVQNNSATPAGTNLMGKVDVQFAGTVPDTGSGTGGTKTQRMLIDSSQLDPTVAHDAVDSGTPYKQGGRAVAGMSGLTLVAAADRTDSLHGIDGAQYVRTHCGLEDIVSGRATDTAGTSTSCIASSGAGVKTYLTSIALCNSSATAVTVNILDGASVKYTLSVPAGSGNNKEFTVPLPGTAATAWNFQSSAAATTITCSMIGFKSKV